VNLARHLEFARRAVQQQTAEQDQLAEVDSFHHHDAQTIRPSDPAGPANPSTYRSASKPPSPWARDRGEDGQHEGGVDNISAGSDNTLDNT
jgi:hypothetical protein